MPTSDSSNISLIVEMVRKLMPSSILDVGIGCAKYGLLFREYLDSIWCNRAFHDPATWQVNIVGLEIFPSYITPVHTFVYDDIIIMDAYKYFEQSASQQFDLIFMGDVIEHFSMEMGKKLLQNIIDNDHLTSNGSVLISTPNFKTRINNPARAFYGNTHEMHLCQWSEQDFIGAPHYKCMVKADKLLTVLLTKE